MKKMSNQFLLGQPNMKSSIIWRMPRSVEWIISVQILVQVRIFQFSFVCFFLIEFDLLIWYGNIGCQVFKGGIQNLIDFWPNMKSSTIWRMQRSVEWITSVPTLVQVWFIEMILFWKFIQIQFQFSVFFDTIGLTNLSNARYCTFCICYYPK